MINGEPLIPFLADENGFFEPPFYLPTDEECSCMLCNREQDKLIHLQLPCVVRPITPTYGAYSSGIVLIKKYRELAAEFLVSVCDVCDEKISALMETSDHAVIAKDDIYDILDEFSMQINDPLWEKYSHKDAEKRFIQKISKKLTVLEHARKDCPQADDSPFTLIPHDILRVISKHLVDAEMNDLAAKIQRLYRNWVSTKRNTSLQWDSDYGRLSFEEAKKKNMWMYCDDCGSKRSLNDICVDSACAHEYVCCLKYRCKMGCHYECPKCSYVHFIYPQQKKNNGTVTMYDCYCGHNMILHEEWYGLDVYGYVRRYN